MHAMRRFLHTCDINLLACCIPTALRLTALRTPSDVTMTGMGFN